jgi:hypothetical protein
MVAKKPTERRRQGPLRSDPAGGTERIDFRISVDAAKLLDIDRALHRQTRAQWLEAAIRERTSHLVVQLRGGAGAGEGH